MWFQWTTPLLVFTTVLVSVSSTLTGSPLSGTCVCATTTVNARSEGSLSGAVLTQLHSGNCGTIYGGIITRDGYKWYEIKYNSQRVWVAGNYLNESPDTSCAAPAAPTLTGCPQIISRAQWGARATRTTSYLNLPVQYAFIHHAESPECNSQSSCSALVRSFQNYHMDTRGWSDIGYSFLVGGDGKVYEGRGFDRVGAHTSGYNSVGLGVCLIGDFQNKSPPTLQIAATHNLIDCMIQKGKLRTDYTLRGHRDMSSTTCPGDTLYGLIRQWPHY